MPGFEAPVYIAWSTQNRSPLVRIPTSRGEEPALSCAIPIPPPIPIWCWAACLAAGMDGIRRAYPPPPVDSNIYRLTEEEREEQGIENIPYDLDHAIRAMKKDALIRGDARRSCFPQICDLQAARVGRLPHAGQPVGDCALSGSILIGRRRYCSI